MSDKKVIEVGDEPRTLASMRIIEQAVQQGLKTEDLTVLYELHKDMQAQQAREQFAAALASFQEECDPIPKNASSKQATGGGSGYAYRYATLDQIERAVKPLLAKRGLSYTFDCVLEEGMIRAICTLRGMGHEITASFIAPIDTRGSMNLIQKHATSLSYAKRYALSQVLGISTTDDNDGQPLEGPTEREVASIDAKQEAELDEWIESSGADRDAMLRYFEIKSLGELPSDLFPQAIAMLKAKGAK